MPATILTAPPARVLSGDPTIVRIGTGLELVSPAARIVFTLGNTGPSSGQELRLQFAGRDLTFLVGTDTEEALELPLRSEAGTLAEYCELWAERFIQNEIVSDYFRVTYTGTTVTLTQRVPGVVDITVTEDLGDVTVAVGDITEASVARALLQVWTDTGNIGTDVLLCSQHSPYPPDGITYIDISAAFAGLKPHLPDPATINPIPVPFDMPNEIATAAFVDYYLRVADKYGTPAVAKALVRHNGTFQAILGSRAGASLADRNAVLRHNYARPDGLKLVKPVTTDQPDWVYVLHQDTAFSSVHVRVIAHWSDGAQSSHVPYGTTPVALNEGEITWYPSGFRQSRLNTFDPPGGADPLAYIVAYDWQLMSDPGDGEVVYLEVNYAVEYRGDWNAYLLFSNGMGGCESAKMSGRTSTKYATTSEIFQQSTFGPLDPAQGQFGTYGATGQPVYEFNTGYYDDPAYLIHLRQLALGDVWLIDLLNRRFLKLIVEAKDMDNGTDDEPLTAFSFTARAAWLDADFNL